MGLKELLVNKIPREVAGSRTSKQYDYQKDLSLLLLLQHHNKLIDYVFLFDYHDDLVIVNSSTAPTSIDFYQIKSKEKGNWSIGGLVNKSKNDDFSIVSKMYLNRITFDAYTQSLNFISNAGFNLISTETKSLKEESVIEIKHLTADIVKKIVSSIKTDHALQHDPAIETLLKFQKQNLY